MAGQTVDDQGQDAPLLVAVFDPKLRIYLFLRASLLLCLTVVGVVLLPLTLAAAWWWAKHYYLTIRCHVTSRRLYFQHGILFQRESAVPLDKIQDMALHKGPVLSILGLTSLRVETAGGSGQMGGVGGVKLLGLREAKAFQEKVLGLRDAIETTSSAISSLSAPTDALPVLLEIRDILAGLKTAVEQNGKAANVADAVDPLTSDMGDLDRRLARVETIIAKSDGGVLQTAMD